MSCGKKHFSEPRLPHIPLGMWQVWQSDLRIIKTNLQFITRRIEVNKKLVNKYLLVKNYWKAKLSNREVETLRQMVEGGEITQKEAAEKFEISKGQVSKIVNHKQR